MKDLSEIIDFHGLDNYITGNYGENVVKSGENVVKSGEHIGIYDLIKEEMSE